MEFERSLFRVYEKMLSSISLGGSSARSWRSFLRVTMFANLAIAVASFLLVIALHVSFAGDGSCLSSTLHGLGLEEARIHDITKNKNLTGLDDMLLSDSVIRVWAFPRTLDDIVASSPLNDERMVVKFEVSKPDYEFCADPAFLLIDESLRPLHVVKEWNITLSSSCLGMWGRNSIFRSLANLAIDDIVVNQFMHGLKDSEGVLRSQSSHETWSWSGDRNAKRDSSTLSRLLMNAFALWRVFILFLLVSSMTALMVRTLVSSGVAIMFPLFSMLRSFGLVQADVFRLLTLSYPWVGGDVEVLEATGQSMGPLIRAHMMNVFVTYAAYEACQFAWRRWMLGFKPQPAGVEVFIFAFVMVCEYYMLIFARSPMTLRYLPRLLALNFVLFLQYTFSVPYGFVSLAGITLWTSTFFWMLYFILECEVKALRRGVVSIETPRAFYTLLASPQWPMALPPHWSTFHEINRAHRSVYETDFSDRDDPERGPTRQTAPTGAPTQTSSSSSVVVDQSEGRALAHRRGARRGESQHPSSLPLVMNPSTTISSTSASANMPGHSDESPV